MSFRKNPVLRLRISREAVKQRSDTDISSPGATFQFKGKFMVVKRLWTSLLLQDSRWQRWEGTEGRGGDGCLFGAVSGGGGGGGWGGEGMAACEEPGGESEEHGLPGKKQGRNC